MGQYSDLYIARQDDAQKLLDPEAEVAWPCLSLKGIIDFEWIALGTVLKAEVFGKDLATKLEGEEGEDGGVLVRPMVASITTKLASLDSAGRLKLAKEWRAESEELGKWDATEVASLVQSLCDFASLAVKEKMPILYVATW